jgi:putative spermidine/putrescine transport system substrate-binding protein
MVERGVIPQELLDALPPAEAYETAVFPTLEEQEAANEAVTSGWDSVVGANVQ